MSATRCLQAMKIVRHHANGRFDWLISGHQGVNPSSEKEFLYCLANTKYLRLSILWFADKLTFNNHFVVVRNQWNLNSVSGQNPPGQNPPDKISQDKIPPGQNPESIEQWSSLGDIMGGFFPGGFCPGGFCPRGILS